MKRTLFFSCLLLLTVSNCDQNEMSIRRFERFVSKIESDYDKLSDKDWSALDDRYSDIFVTEFEPFNPGYSPVNIEKINDLRKKYKDLKINHEKESFIRNLERFVTDIQSNIEEDFNQEWEDIDYEFSENLESQYKALRNYYSLSDREKVNDLRIKYYDLKVIHEKKAFIRDLKSFVEDAEIFYSNYNYLAWSNLVEEFNEDIEVRWDLLRDSFSLDERQNLNALMAKFKELQSRIDAEESKAEVNYWWQQFKETIKSLLPN